ncbi:hypothetical protein HNR23_001443 [Nocardiopsis mwathae]|uniref:Uncharacterized protein n=1 Tax=Nocardiopsis mwathae TaxID=1472723 RepID=A0A7W9YFU3_9ACTN|nr:hypothetical protein [Nocardiopsis mwathae]MBB6171383.1 hypothetical protein [Nocardiopsis mwathae]
MQPIRTLVRRAAALGVAALVGVTLLGSAPAGVGQDMRTTAEQMGASDDPKHDPWLYDPAVIKDGKVASSTKTDSGTIHLAYGTYLGIQYAWAWVQDPANPDHHLSLDVDLDGDRRWDDSRYVRLGDRQYTPGYPTAKTSERAFQACILEDTALPCKPELRSPWW